MQRAINLARGVAHIEVVCLYPERFVNMCALNGVEFWDLERGENGVLRMYIRASGFKKLRGLSPKYGFEITRAKKSGAPYFMRRLRKRYALLLGLVFIALAVRALALFVWDIRVYGNDNVPTSQILRALDKYGFRAGCLGIGVSSEKLANQVLIEIPELSWLAVNVRGSRAEVLVRERIPAPEILDENEPAMVVASFSGIVTKMSVMEGLACVKVGDTVMRGDVLVTGAVADKRGNVRGVHALADVEARTWRVLEAQMPLVTSAKRYTDEKIVKNSIILAGNTINLFFNSSVPWSDYDKIVAEHPLTLPGGVVLPITVVTTRYDEYVPIVTEVLEPVAEKTLKKDLVARLTDEIAGGSILSMEFETRTENGVTYVTLRAECVEHIAVERAFTPEESAQLGS